MEKVLAALAEQQNELVGYLAPLDDAAWKQPTPCEGWDIADVVLHVAQTNEFAVASARGTIPPGVVGFAVGPGANNDTVDDAAAFQVMNERGAPARDINARWEASARDLLDALRACDPSKRVLWVAGDMAAQTLATTRLAETWIHTGDVAVALGHPLVATDRLWHIARLAWRTLPYAFTRSGRELSGSVAVELTAPDGSTWAFGTDTGAPTTIRGDAHEFCLLAGQRLRPHETSLQAEGPDGAGVLDLVRTYA